MNARARCSRWRKQYRGVLALWAMLAMVWLPGKAAAEEAELRMAIYLPQKHTRETYQPLADYLSARIGRPVRLITTINFLSHWQLFKRENYEIVLDGPHFTDYRVHKMGYRPIAKLPSVVSYSLVTSEDTLVLDVRDLIGREIATPPSPGLGALWLNDIYPNPLQQPEIVEVEDSAEAVEKIREGKAVAAMIPTPFLQRYSSVVPVETTSQVPAPALSVSGELDETTVAKLRRALLSAGSDPEGRAMLDAIGVPAFEPADENVYEGQAGALRGAWDY